MARNDTEIYGMFVHETAHVNRAHGFTRDAMHPELAGFAPRHGGTSRAPAPRLNTMTDARFYR
jgi:hypothetical protein